MAFIKLGEALINLDSVFFIVNESQPDSRGNYSVLVFLNDEVNFNAFTGTKQECDEVYDNICDRLIN